MPALEIFRLQKPGVFLNDIKSLKNTNNLLSINFIIFHITRAEFVYESL